MEYANIHPLIRNGHVLNPKDTFRLKAAESAIADKSNYNGLCHLYLGSWRRKRCGEYSINSWSTMSVKFGCGRHWAQSHKRTKSKATWLTKLSTITFFPSNQRISTYTSWSPTPVDSVTVTKRWGLTHPKLPMLNSFHLKEISSINDWWVTTVLVNTANTKHYRRSNTVTSPLHSDILGQVGLSVI